MTVLRVAAIQSPVTIDPVANTAVIRELIRRAHADGATVMHLPEGALSGYAGGDKPHFRGWNVDWSLVRAGLLALMELAAELKVWIIVGSNHPLTAPHRPHNSVYVISSQGTLAGRYDKRWLSNGEITEFYTPGTAETLFEVDGFTFGIAVCISPHLEDHRCHPWVTERQRSPATEAFDCIDYGGPCYISVRSSGYRAM